MITEAEEVPAGHVCSQLGDSSGSGMGQDTDEFWLRESTDHKGHRIEWGSFEETLGSKYFDRDFFASGDVERFIVTEPSGAQHSFMVWGAHGCERCPADYEFEALPGDLWGCGTEPSGDSTTTAEGTSTDGPVSTDAASTASR
jgi:hypothetical protein